MLMLVTGCSHSAGNQHDSASACTGLFLSSLLQSARCELFFPATSKLSSYKLHREKTGNKSIWPRVFLACDLSLAHVCTLSSLGKKHGPDITAQKSCIYALVGSFSHVFLYNISSFIQKQHQSLGDEVWAGRCWSVWCASEAMTRMQLLPLNLQQPLVHHKSEPSPSSQQ